MVIPVRLATVIALAALVVAACAAPTAPESFDPSQPCSGADEQRMAGAYPELEAAVPSTLAGQPPTVRTSGRYCSAVTLGSLLDAGITEAHFGAATWDHGGGQGISLVVFEAVGLTAQAVFDSYLAGAQANSKVHDLKVTSPTLAGSPGHRLDFLNGDSSFQRILIWPGDRDGRVRVVLAADLLDSEIQAAVDAFR